MQLFIYFSSFHMAKAFLKNEIYLNGIVCLLDYYNSTRFEQAVILHISWFYIIIPKYFIEYNRKLVLILMEAINHIRVHQKASSYLRIIRWTVSITGNLIKFKYIFCSLVLIEISWTLFVYNVQWTVSYSKWSAYHDNLQNFFNCLAACTRWSTCCLTEGWK